MTALAANANRAARGTQFQMVSLPVNDGAVIYKGAIVMIDADGYAIAATDTAGLRVAGIAHDKRDNTGGAAGALQVPVEFGREYLFAATSITQAMLGASMMVVDDNTMDDAAGATNDRVLGNLTEFVSTTQGWVYVPGLSTYLL